MEDVICIDFFQMWMRERERERERARTEDAGWGKLRLKIRDLSPELRNTGNENFI